MLHFYQLRKKYNINHITHKLSLEISPSIS